MSKTKRNFIPDPDVRYIDLPKILNGSVVWKYFVVREISGKGLGVLCKMVPPNIRIGRDGQINFAGVGLLLPYGGRFELESMLPHFRKLGKRHHMSESCIPNMILNGDEAYYRKREANLMPYSWIGSYCNEAALDQAYNARLTSIPFNSDRLANSMPAYPGISIRMDYNLMVEICTPLKVGDEICVYYSDQYTFDCNYQYNRKPFIPSQITYWPSNYVAEYEEDNPTSSQSAIAKEIVKLDEDRNAKEARFNSRQKQHRQQLVANRNSMYEKKKVLTENLIEMNKRRRLFYITGALN